MKLAMRSLAALASFLVQIRLAAFLANFEVLESATVSAFTFGLAGEHFFGFGESTSRFHFVVGDLTGLLAFDPVLVRVWPPLPSMLLRAHSEATAFSSSELNGAEEHGIWLSSSAMALWLAVATNAS